MSLRHFEFNKSRLVLLVALLFATVGAGLFQTPPIVFMASVLCGAPLIGSFVGRLVARSLSLKRQFPEVGTVGDIVTARFALHNRSSWPAFLIHSRALSRRNNLAGKLRPLDETENVLPILLPKATESWEQRWRLERRGLHELSGAEAGALDPLGLYARLGARTPAQQILVLPLPLKIGRLAWSGTRSSGDRPLAQAVRVADTADFHGIRPYQQGEGLHRVHWKSSARTGQLHVIEWEEEIASDLTLWLDVQGAVHSGAEGQGSLETLVTLTASVGAFLLQSGHRFGVAWWEDAPDKAKRPQLCRLEARGISGLEAILRALARLQPSHHPEATLQNLVAEGLAHLVRGQGVLLITTDRAAPLGEKLSAQGQRVIQSLILDATSFEDTVPQVGSKLRRFSKSADATQGRREASRFIRPRHKRRLTENRSATPESGNRVQTVTTYTDATARRVRRGDSLVAVLERGV